MARHIERGGYTNQDTGATPPGEVFSRRTFISGAAVGGVLLSAGIFMGKNVMTDKGADKAPYPPANNNNSVAEHRPVFTPTPRPTEVETPPPPVLEDPMTLEISPDLYAGREERHPKFAYDVIKHGTSEELRGMFRITKELAPTHKEYPKAFFDRLETGLNVGCMPEALAPYVGTDGSAFVEKMTSYDHHIVGGLFGHGFNDDGSPNPNSTRVTLESDAYRLFHEAHEHLLWRYVNNAIYNKNLNETIKLSVVGYEKPSGNEVDTWYFMDTDLRATNRIKLVNNPADSYDERGEIITSVETAYWGADFFYSGIVVGDSLLGAIAKF